MEPKGGRDKKRWCDDSSIPHPPTHNKLSWGTMSCLWRLFFVGSRLRRRRHTKIETYLCQIEFNEVEKIGCFTVVYNLYTPLTEKRLFSKFHCHLSPMSSCKTTLDNNHYTPPPTLPSTQTTYAATSTPHLHHPILKHTYQPRKTNDFG